MTDPIADTPILEDPTATPGARRHTWSEKIDIAGDELVGRVKHLAAEGSVRRIRITEPDGDLVLEVPLTIGAIAGGVVVLAAPMLAVIGAVAAFFSKVRIEVIRETPPTAAASTDTPAT